MADTQPPIEGMKLCPEGLPLMLEAWVSCVLWASTMEEIRDEFTKDTGLKLEGLLNRSGLEIAIDKATGHERAVLVAFADFVTEHLWGQAGAS